ncbi:MAG: hypothetical protein ACRD25_03670 [Terracidiphilus sp.]
MSAGDRWHEHGTVKDQDPPISSAVLLWMRGQGGAEQATLPWEADPEGAFGPEPGPGDAPESEDVLANLLRAIEKTEIAARFQNAAPPDKGHPSADTRHEPVETAVPRPPETGAVAAASAEPTPSVADESSEVLETLLRALNSTRVAATLEGAPHADGAEASRSDDAIPVETVETLSTVPQEPETELAPQVAPEADEAPAMAPDAIESSDAALSLHNAPLESETESAEIASSAPVEATLSLEPPLVPALPSATKHENRSPKRTARRRLSGRRRLDYLLSIAAPTAEPPRDAAEPQPVKALPVIEAKPVGEPERRVTAEPAPMADAHPLPAEPAPMADAHPLPAAADGATPKIQQLARLGPGIGSLTATGDLINEGLNRAEMHLENWFQRFFAPPDPRHNMRVEKPPLVAYHWIVDVPQALKIADVSAGGLHLITKDRWSEGNIISMTLQRTDKVKGSADSWIAVDFLVMRWCEDGMAGAFMASTPGLAYTVAGRAGNCADRKTLVRFVDRLADAAADRLAVRK